MKVRLMAVCVAVFGVLVVMVLSPVWLLGLTAVGFAAAASVVPMKGADRGMTDGTLDKLKDICGRRAWRLDDVLGSRAGSPEVRLLYARPNGDTTWLPSSRHAYWWLSRGFTAIDVRDDIVA
jgi:hypothetical protein